MRHPGRIGIDLGGTKIEGVVLDAQGAIVLRTRVASPSQSYSSIVSAICALVESLSQEAQLPADTPIGIGTPGAWQPHESAMKNCNSTVLNGKPLLADLIAALGPRVRIANDANCFALSEAVDGAAKGAATVFGVILGTGVGGGIVVNQQPLLGPNAIAGEWGHTPVAYLRHAAGSAGTAGTAGVEGAEATDPLGASVSDRLCYCGRFNCVETFLSGPGLARTAQEVLGEPLSAEEVFAVANAMPVRDAYLEMLAAALAQVINVLDPDVVVLGGGLSAQPILYRRLPQLLLPYLFSAECHTRLVPPVHGDSSGVRGAAWLWPPIR